MNYIEVLAATFSTNSALFAIIKLLLKYAWLRVFP